MIGYIGDSYPAALIHSPLVGPVTWEPVAAELRRRGFQVIVPVFSDHPGARLPYWKQHAQSAARAIQQEAGGSPVILVGHSGAGPILPAIRQAIGSPVAAYLFVDAGLPKAGATRLQLMEMESPEWAAEFRQFIEAGGRFPSWSEKDLAEIVPDSRLRVALLAQLRPRGMDFFTEPIPVFSQWPDAACAYLHFSPPYDQAAAQAQQLGWSVQKLEAGHFHMLVDPSAVVDELLKLIEEIED